jgi:hypothetical protein
VRVLAGWVGLQWVGMDQAVDSTTHWPREGWNDYRGWNLEAELAEMVFVLAEYSHRVSG